MSSFKSVQSKGCLLILTAVTVTTLFMVVASLTTLRASAESPISWKSLNEQLAAKAAVTDTFKPEKWSDIAAFASILKANDRVLYNEMVRQGKFPYVVIAGVFAIDHQDPVDAYGAAMCALVNAEVFGNNVWGVGIDYLQNAKSPPKDVFVAQFEEICGSYHPDQRAGMVALVQLLPIESLEAWLRSPPRTRSASAESIVVGRLYGEYRHPPADVPEWLKTKRAAYRNIPGSPRAVYVYYIDRSDEENLKMLLPDVLADQSLDDTEVMAAVLRHKDFIMRSINIESLQLDPKRSELIQRLTKLRK